MPTVANGSPAMFSRSSIPKPLYTTSSSPSASGNSSLSPSDIVDGCNSLTSISNSVANAAALSMDHSGVDFSPANNHAPNSPNFGRYHPNVKCSYSMDSNGRILRQRYKFEIIKQNSTKRKNFTKFSCSNIFRKDQF